MSSYYIFFFFFFNDTATTEIYTLSLHDALPIYTAPGCDTPDPKLAACHHDTTGLIRPITPGTRMRRAGSRSEEHTSELQSLAYLVCRLLLEKKKKKTKDVEVRCQNVHSDS